VTIGEATLYLGDCLHVLAEIDQVDGVITDPPYSSGGMSNFRQEKHLKIANDETADVAIEAIRWAIDRADHSVYAFGRWDNLIEYPKPRSLVTWVKNNWSMGDLKHEHARQTEVAFFYPGPNHEFPGKRPTDVIEWPRTQNEYHPTEKPVGLMKLFVEQTKGTVVDPFMGSGTTSVAALQMGRKFIGIEREPKYFEIACQRIDQATRQADLIGHCAPVTEQMTLPT